MGVARAWVSGREMRRLKGAEQSVDSFGAVLPDEDIPVDGTFSVPPSSRSSRFPPDVGTRSGEGEDLGNSIDGLAMVCPADCLNRHSRQPVETRNSRVARTAICFQDKPRMRTHPQTIFSRSTHPKQFL